MTLAIAIGNNIDDIRNIENTISILKYANMLMNDEKIDFPNLFLNDSHNKFTSDDIESIIDWHSGIYNLLTNPSLFSSEEETID
jgi:hypothetical protein